MNQHKLETFLNKYSERLTEFEYLKDEGLKVLKENIAISGIKVHSITGRIKKVDSCVNKINAKKIEKPFEDIRDFIALRVVCLFLSDLDRVEEVINQTFEVIERKDKTNDSGNDVFGYMGTHFIVKLKVEPVINRVPFEIQVRTISQDAWASVSHHLDYKNKLIPEKLAKDFHALSGLFYVADTHFSFIKNDRMQ